MAEDVPAAGGADPVAAGGAVSPDWECCVLHVDMDSFFASVEVLDDPSLAGRPVVVGGTGARGVVASCTYEARAFGVRSAMPSGEARRRCPHAVFLDGRYWRYAEVSEQLHAICRAFTPVTEGIGLDEAFLDVSGVRRRVGPPTTIARAIRARVADELSLTCSVGVARTKLLAKLASRAAKPTVSTDGPAAGAGVFVVLPADEWSFLEPMSVRALWGVGPATARRLEQMGVTTVAALGAIPEDTLRRALGDAQGRVVAAMARGEDDRAVVADRPLKSVGHEETFPRDVALTSVLHEHVVRMGDAVAHRLRKAGTAGRTVTLKLRYGDMTTVTRSHTVPEPLDGSRAISAIADALLGGLDVSPGVRLLGVSVSGLAPRDHSRATQLVFDLDGCGPDGTRPDRGAADEARSTAWSEVEAAVAAIRARYGHRSVGPATLAGAGRLRTKHKGETQWGPSADDDRAAGGGPRRAPRP